MTEVKHLTTEIEEGVTPASKTSLAELSAALLGIDTDQSQAGIVAPLLSYSRNGLKDEVEALLADHAGVLLHEIQTLEQSRSPDRGIRIETAVRIEGGERPGIQADADLFDLIDGEKLGSAKTVLRKMPVDAVSQLLANAVTNPSDQEFDAEMVTTNVTAGHLQTHADLYQDHNPIHLDREYATKLGFETLVVPGLLILGLVPDALHNQFPDRTLTKMRARFLSPGYAGQQLHFRIKSRGARGDELLARVFVSSSDDRLLAIIDSTLS